MPKSSPKAQPKKTKPNKTQPKQASITQSKYYWIALTLLMVVFGSVYGYMMKVAAAAIGFMLASVLIIIAFAVYVNFKPSTLSRSSRATFIFAGACFIGFSIWAALTFAIYQANLWPQIASAVGDSFFAITTFIVCEISGAFIGDVIGNHKERISTFLRSKLGR